MSRGLDPAHGSSPLLAVRWTASALVFRQVLLIGTIAILARLLDPDDFGLMAMALVVIGFATMFRDLGAAQSIVQKNDLTDRYISGQFYFILAVSMALTLLVFLLAPLIAALFREPDLVPIVRALAPLFLITGAASVSQALLERRLAFSMVSKAEATAAASAAAVAVAFAIGGAGVWSLVAQSLVMAAVSTVLLIVSARWRPQILFGWAEARAAVSFGAALTTFNVSNFVSRNADYFLVGRVLGATELGYYTLAYRVMSVPVQLISGAFGRVLFPVISRARHDDVQTRALYLRALGSVGYVAFPMGLVLAVTAHRVVPVLMGPGWEPAIAVLQILALVAVGQAIGSTIGPVWMATGHVREMAAYGIASSIVVVTGFLVAVQHGITAVALAYFVTSIVILLIPSMWLALRHIGLSLRTLPKFLSRSFITAVLVAGVVYFIDLGMENVGNVIALSLDVAVAVCLYALLSILINRPQLMSLLSFLGLRGALVNRYRRRGAVPDDMSRST